MISAGEVNAREKVPRKFVVAGGDGTKVLYFVEESLDEIAFAVESKVTRRRCLTVGFGWNHWSDVSLGESVAERISRRMPCQRLTLPDRRLRAATPRKSNREPDPA
jgi:hypothetical protein